MKGAVFQVSLTKELKLEICLIQMLLKLFKISFVWMIPKAIPKLQSQNMIKSDNKK
jgi:hypothetical protein